MKKLIISLFLITAFYCVLITAVRVITDYQVFSPERSLIFRVDSSFSKEEIVKIQSAFNKWNKASAGCLNLKFYIAKIPLKDIFIWSADKISTIYNAKNIFNWKYHAGKQLCGDLCLGVSVMPSGDIFIFEGGILFETIVLHELGHMILGGEHSKNKNDLMFPYLGNKPKEISLKEEGQVKCNHNLTGKEF